MKKTSFNTTALGIFLLVFFGNLSMAIANNSPKIVRMNWEDPMYMAGHATCVAVGPDNTVTLRFYLSAALYPTIDMLPLHIFYQLSSNQNVQSGYTAALNAANYTLVNSQWETTVITQVSLVDDCEGSTNICMEVYWGLVTPDVSTPNPNDYVRYPIYMYPAWWPSQIYWEADGYNPLAPTYKKLIEICCYGPVQAPRMEECTSSFAISAGQSWEAFGEEQSLAKSELEEQQPAASADGYKGYVFPNPVTNLAKINYWSNGLDAVNIRLFDAKGNTVAKLQKEGSKAGPSTTEIDFSALSPGLYFIQLNDGARQQLFRVVKQ